MDNSTDVHLAAIHKVLRYVKSTSKQCIFFPVASNFHLKTYNDADWAGCLNTRRSTTGYCVFLGDALISWKSNKQATISKFLASSEYKAIASTCWEVIWLLLPFKELQISHPQLTLIFCDNKVAQHISYNPIFHEKIKYIEINCHVVRKKLVSKVVKAVHVTFKHQWTDMFTKSLSYDHFYILLDRIDVNNIYTPS